MRYGTNKTGETMKDTPNHLKVLTEIEQEAMPGLVEILNKEGLESVRSTLWDMAGWTQASSFVWKTRPRKEQKRIDWELAVRIERTLATVLNEAHKQQAEKVIKTFSKRPERRGCSTSLSGSRVENCSQMGSMMQGWSAGMRIRSFIGKPQHLQDDRASLSVLHVEVLPARVTA